MEDKAACWKRGIVLLKGCDAASDSRSRVVMTQATSYTDNTFQEEAVIDAFHHAEKS